MYRIFGYYICEKMAIPNFLSIKGDEMITVSDCFSGIHPNLTYCYFSNPQRQERVEYLTKWNINEEKAILLEHDINSMFENSLSIDGRFLHLSDAQRICKNYFDSNQCVIVSVSTTAEYYDIITNEIRENANGRYDFFTDVFDENDLLGYDILGWDLSGFHTFLCNGLHRESELLKFNKYCLLENDFETVQNFAKDIRDKGEPVEWIPCRIGICQ